MYVHAGIAKNERIGAQSFESKSKSRNSAQCMQYICNMPEQRCLERGFGRTKERKETTFILDAEERSCSGVEGSHSSSAHGAARRGFGGNRDS